MARGLLDMPEVVITKILVDSGIKGILTLRKVCHNLRNFIDNVKPYANLKGITVSGENDECISVHYDFEGEFHHVQYQKDEKGCLVQNIYDDGTDGKEVLLKNEDFITVSMKDFRIVLEHQKSVLKYLALSGGNEDDMNGILLEKIQQILKSRVHPLKVKWFTVYCMDQDQIISALPFFNSNTLKTLEIRNDEKYLEIDKLVKLDHWRNIKHMKLFSCFIDYKYIHHFAHFSNDLIRLKSTHFPDLVLLKNLFLQSSGFRHIYFEPADYDLNDVQRSIELLGKPFFDIEEEEEEDEHWKKWYYRYPATTESVLEISVQENIMTSGIIIELTKINKYDVPDEAVIQN